VGAYVPVLFKHLNYLTDFQEAWYENHVIDWHTSAVFSNTQRSVITTRGTRELLSLECHYRRVVLGPQLMYGKTLRKHAAFDKVVFLWTLK
jgi:hypothetical protein